jgi:MerE protein
MARMLGGYLLGATALVACPSHRPLTLPLLLAGLGGTTFGAVLRANPQLVFVGAAVYFVLAVAGAV